MSQIMVEAFARGLLDKIMLEAFNIAETNTQDRKHWTVNCNTDSNVENLAGELIVQQPAVLGQHPVHDTTFARYNDVQAPEAIAKMLHGLCDMQIGDTSYVLPPTSSLLERQVKHALHNIEVRTTDDSVETGTIQGQGDVDKRANESTIELAEKKAKDSVTNARDRESHDATEAQRISVSLLHRMIAELETKKDESAPEKANTVDRDETSQWEEGKETSEFVDQPCLSEMEEPSTSSSPIESPLASSSRNLPCLHEIDLKESISSSPFAADKSSQITKDVVKLSSPPRGTTVVSTSISPASDETQEQSTKQKRQKKDSVGTRLKRFLQSTFGRRKN